nr:immunoglobulin light chain junction region [Macaca mulatta]
DYYCQVYDSGAHTLF